MIAVHPGKVIKEMYLKPLRMSDNTFAEESGINYVLATYLLNGFAIIDTDTAKKLAKLFNTSEEYWLNLQDNYNKANKETNKCA